MFVHAPASVTPGAPIVVALHGCTQSASAYAAAGWNALVDREGFGVVYPEQSSTNDIQRCFRWWDPAHTTRDRGEAKSVYSMVQAARDKYGAKGDAIVTGLSAGAASCGKAGAFMLDVALCSTQKAADFFGLTSSSTVGPNGAPPPPSSGTRPNDCN